MLNPSLYRTEKWLVLKYCDTNKAGRTYRYILAFVKWMCRSYALDMQFGGWTPDIGRAASKVVTLQSHIENIISSHRVSEL